MHAYNLSDPLNVQKKTKKVDTNQRTVNKSRYVVFICIRF